MVAPLEKLVACLSRLPTIGRKSAWRLALHMMERPEQELQELARAIAELQKSVRPCPRCFTYTDQELCELCSSTTRDQGVICVVEKPTDVLTVEKAGRYRGVYHVLGGVLSPINGITPDKLRIAELSQRIDSGAVSELILGLGGSAEAETTELYLARLYGERGVRITRFARGLPAGMDLEYIDQITLTQALQERIEVHYNPRGS
ncbi:MAG: recombination protein RecR [Chitinivibrionales bacterium]|nr:recombination protein RecR [Chitinivibrionales bacterium]